MDKPYPKLHQQSLIANPATNEDNGVSFRQTDPEAWLVTIDGDERIISQDARGFIAWIGHQSRHWSFHGALNACVEDARHQRFLQDRAEALSREQDRRLAALSPQQFAYVLAARERELAGLSVNSPGRADMLRGEIQAMSDYSERAALMRSQEEIW